MSETIEQQAPLDRFFDTAGASAGGIQVTKQLIEKNGQDPIARAKDAANRGVLSTAAEFIAASGLPDEQKLKLLNQAAEQTMRTLLDITEKGKGSAVNTSFTLRAVAVFQATKKVLEGSQPRPVNPTAG